MAELTSPPITLKGEGGLTFEENLTSPDLTLSAQAGLEVQNTLPTLSASGTFTVEGLKVIEHRTGYHHVAKYVGERRVPPDIRRLRKYVYEVMRRMGTPVLFKKMLNEDDIFDGTVETSGNFNKTYGQTRNRDPLSHGIGFVSVERHPEEWIDPRTTEIVVSQESPGQGWNNAPKYRGYGPGMLLWMIEPDAAEDFFKHTPEGVFMKVQSAQAVAPWWPDINDNDLLIHVELDRRGNIIDTAERYQAKMTNPVSIRGSNERGRAGRHEYSGDFGTRYVVNTTFEMVLLPRTHEAQWVEVDR